MFPDEIPEFEKKALIKVCVAAYGTFRYFDTHSKNAVAFRSHPTAALRAFYSMGVIGEERFVAGKSTRKRFGRSIVTPVITAIETGFGNLCKTSNFVSDLRDVIIDPSVALEQLEQRYKEIRPYLEKWKISPTLRLA